MPIISFNKATNPPTPSEIMVNTTTVQIVEASSSIQLGHTIIHVTGQSNANIMVTEAIDQVVAAIGGLVPATRHYLGHPQEGGNTVYIAPSNISYLRPDPPNAPVFWHVSFIDGFELRILHPLPLGILP